MEGWEEGCSLWKKLGLEEEDDEMEKEKDEVAISLVFKIFILLNDKNLSLMIFWHAKLVIYQIEPI